MTTFTTEDRLAAKAQEGQNPIQTRYGALYYETPYRGESTCSSCDGSCGYIRGIKHESQYLGDYIEQKKW